MAILANGIETLEIGATAWRQILNTNWGKVYTQTQINTLFTNFIATAHTFSAPQRGTLLTDNDLSFDLNSKNNFKCTPTANGALTFTNIASASGQIGTVILVNTTPRTITLGASILVDSNFLTTINTAGTYWIEYFCDGTNVYLKCTEALS
jgi:hypothetical protein